MSTKIPNRELARRLLTNPLDPRVPVLSSIGAELYFRPMTSFEVNAAKRWIANVTAISARRVERIKRAAIQAANHDRRERATAAAQAATRTENVRRVNAAAMRMVGASS